MKNKKGFSFLALIVVLVALVVMVAIFYGPAKKVLVGQAYSLGGEVALYPFNDGTANDYSGNGHHGELVPLGSGPTVEVNGRDGFAFNFNVSGDSNDHIDISDSPVWDLGGRMSVSAWIKTDVRDSKGRGIVLFDNTNFKWLLYFNEGISPNDELYFYVRTTTAATPVLCVRPDGSLTDDRWHMLTGTYDSTLSSDRLKLFIDGVQCGSANGFDEPIVTGTAGQGVMIGRYLDNYFDGSIDDVRIYNRPLTAIEISGLYSRFTPPVSTTILESLTLTEESIGLYSAKSVALQLIVYARSSSDINICRQNAVGSFPSFAECGGTSRMVVSSLGGYDITLGDGTCYRVDSGNFPMVNLYNCDTFALLVECPVTSVANAVIRCTLVLDRDIKDSFGAQFVIDAPGLTDVGSGTGGINFVPIAPLTGDSGGLGRQTIIYSVQTYQPAGPVATFAVLGSTPGTYTISLSNLLVASSSVPATVTIVISDSDGDGVPNSVDLCPSTPVGVAVNVNGCSVGQLCGNNILDLGEVCDDSNTVVGDGCSSTCTIEQGWSCTTVGIAGRVGIPLSQCSLICGDGIVIGAEQCDDSNAVSGDGCSSACLIEGGFTCAGTPSVCTKAVLCGDGIISGTEVCDDGNSLARDGCSSVCTIEQGWSCRGSTSICTLGDIDGNGIINIVDLIFIVRHVVGTAPLSSASFTAADATCDAEVNVRDLLRILTMILNPTTILRLTCPV